MLDVAAFGSLGVLSFAALAGNQTVSAIPGVLAYGSYLSARVLGVVRPVVYRNRMRSRGTAPVYRAQFGDLMAAEAEG